MHELCHAGCVLVQRCRRRIVGDLAGFLNPANPLHCSLESILLSLIHATCLRRNLQVGWKPSCSRALSNPRKPPRSSFPFKKQVHTLSGASVVMPGAPPGKCRRSKYLGPRTARKQDLLCHLATWIHRVDQVRKAGRHVMEENSAFTQQLAGNLVRGFQNSCS